MRYEAAGLTTVTGSGAATLALKAGASDDCTLFELGIFLNAATASIFGVYRSTAPGTSSATLTPVATINGASAAAARVETAWSVQPTLAAVPFRSIGFPAAVGNGIPWTWSGGLHIPAGGSVVLKCEAVTSAVRFYVVYDE